MAVRGSTGQQDLAEGTHDTHTQRLGRGLEKHVRGKAARPQQARPQLLTPRAGEAFDTPRPDLDPQNQMSEERPGCREFKNLLRGLQRAARVQKPGAGGSRSEEPGRMNLALSGSGLLAGSGLRPLATKRRNQPNPEASGAGTRRLRPRWHHLSHLWS